MVTGVPNPNLYRCDKTRPQSRVLRNTSDNKGAKGDDSFGRRERDNHLILLIDYLCQSKYISETIKLFYATKDSERKFLRQATVAFRKQKKNTVTQGSLALALCLMARSHQNFFHRMDSEGRESQLHWGLLIDLPFIHQLSIRLKYGQCERAMRRVQMKGKIQ